MSKPGSYRFDTRVIHAGEAPDPVTGAHGVPMYQNSTYAFRSAEQVEAFQNGMAPHFVYSRGGNPTVRCFELKMADLEGAARAVGAATGMAAITATLSEVLAGGGELVAANNVYFYADEFMRDDLPLTGSAVRRVDITDLAAVEAAMTPRTRAIYCETFSNPLMIAADLPGLAEIAHRHGALLIVDNTFLSPAIIRPLEHGADVVIHSATKYLTGSGQVMGGVVSGSCELIDRIDHRLVRTGGTMAPFAAWMLLAGIKTLPLRIDRHCSTANAIANLLEASPVIERVNWPALPSHPGHAVASRLVGDRCGGLFSFWVRGGRPAANAFVNGLRLCTIAVSLGEATTLIWPSGDGMVRLAVGLEDPADLLADIEGGLAAAGSIAADLVAAH